MKDWSYWHLQLLRNCTNSYLHRHLNMVSFFLHTFNHKMHVLYMHRNIQSWKMKPNPAVPGVTT